MAISDSLKLMSKPKLVMSNIANCPMIQKQAGVSNTGNTSSGRGNRFTALGFSPEVTSPFAGSKVDITEVVVRAGIPYAHLVILDYLEVIYVIGIPSMTTSKSIL